ncbi:MAG: S8 family peptidase [Bacteroidales bacterium]|nr:S8 family peptidase [Bacteroidales bacterium]
MTINRTLAASVAILSLLTGSAQGLSLRDRMMLRHQQSSSATIPTAVRHPLQQPATVQTSSAGLSTSLPSRSYAMLRLADGATLADIAAMEGLEVLSERHGFVAVLVDNDKAEDIAASRSVARMSLSRKIEPKMDRARLMSRIDDIHEGTGLTQPYTGKGVVAGIVDEGFDPNNANFRNADGSSRISTLCRATITSSGSINLKYYDPSTIENFSTDDNTTYHGTHTLGTMAGSYRGEGRVALENDDNTGALVSTCDIPYYGVAYDADLAVGAGASYDALIAYGIDNILNYAYYMDSPCVINLSLGSSQGPHDGNNLMGQFLEACAEQDNAIFCIAAGNEGDMKIAINKTFTEEDNALKTFLYPMVYPGPENGNLRAGSVEIYSNDSTVFTLSVVIYNKQRGRIAWSKGIDVNLDGEGVYYVSSSSYAESSDDIIDSQLAKYFEGYVGFGSMIDEDTGRYYAMIDCYTIDNAENNADGNYILGFTVTGPAGQRVDAYGDSYYMEFSDYDQEGWDDGSYNGTISDLASSRKVVVVGSYNSRETWPLLDGTIGTMEGYSFPVGEVTYFSSYGTLADGRNLPHVLAPGAGVVSSISSPYLSAVYDSGYDAYADDLYSAVATAYGRDNYYFRDFGTSMATPVVAGSIALWLEANPALTVDDVLDIISKTSQWDALMEKAADPVQVGNGRFDAYAGLVEAIRLAGISTVGADSKSPLMVRSLGGRSFLASLPGAESVRCEVYDTTGHLVARASTPGDELTLDLNRLAKGVYILRVNNTHSQKLLLP